MKKIYLAGFLIVFLLSTFSHVQAQTIFGEQPPPTSGGQLEQGNQIELGEPSNAFNPNPFGNPDPFTQTPTPDPINPISPSNPPSNSNSIFTCNSSIKNIGDLFNYARCLIGKAIIPLLFSVALVIFIYGVIQYVLNPASSTKREEGGKYMLWGILALFVMVSVWGLVSVLTNTFFPGLDNTTAPVPPTFR